MASEVSDIRKKRLAIAKVVERAKQALIDLQAECEHPLYTAEYGGNTGNWCESDDSYWVDFHCPDCDWKMRAYSDDPEGSRYYHGNHPRKVMLWERRR